MSADNEVVDQELLAKSLHALLAVLRGPQADVLNTVIELTTKIQGRLYRERQDLLRLRRFISPAMDIVSIERHRQINVYGYTPAHDREHEADHLALAAICYLMPEATRERFHFVNDTETRLHTWWPFEPHYFKPSPRNRLRELVKGTALALAEIDRLIAIESTETQPGEIPHAQ